MSYTELLKDPRWQKKRLEILEAAEWECENCGDKGKTLHVHHKRYRAGAMPWEYERDDLEVLCERCHNSITALLAHWKTLSAEVASIGDLSLLSRCMGYLSTAMPKMATPPANESLEYYEFSEGAQDRLRGTDASKNPVDGFEPGQPWRVYFLGIRDYFSLCTLPVEEYLARVRSDPGFDQTFIDSYNEARAAFVAKGGDVEHLRMGQSDGVFWDWMGDGPAFIFKEDNNGATYIVVKWLRIDTESECGYFGEKAEKL